MMCLLMYPLVCRNTGFVVPSRTAVPPPALHSLYGKRVMLNRPGDDVIGAGDTVFYEGKRTAVLAPPPDRVRTCCGDARRAQAWRVCNMCCSGSNRRRCVFYSISGW